MKVLTVAIPCYNSAEYMNHSINTLLSAKDDIEIIIVDDGSTDNTINIANEYADKYPEVIRVIHKENGGHGSAVNAGLKHASGIYFKVVDSDDWVDEGALKKVITTLKDLVAQGTSPDMFIANYVYEKVSEGKRKAINYNGAIPKDKLFTWDDIMHFKLSQNILMHSAIYRTRLLKDCHISLPEHTFYVDNIFVFVPLPYVKSLYYMDVNLYRYFIGRDDQSVNEKVMISRVEQQIKITKIMVEAHDISQIKSKKLQNYMIKYLSMMMAICSVLLIKEGSEESIEKKKELWEYLKKYDHWLYKKVKSCFLGRASNLSGKFAHRVIEAGYYVTKKIYRFN